MKNTNIDKQFYSLTPAQKSLIFSQKFSILKTVNTIGTSFFIDIDYDVDLLKRAICIAYEKQECVRMRLEKVNKEVCQYIYPYSVPEIGDLDFRGKSKEQQEAKLEKLTKVNLSKCGKPMNKIYVVHTHDNLHGIYMAVSHIAMDSIAIFNFYIYIHNIYLSLKDRTPLPKDPAPYIQQIEKELKYLDSEQYKADIKFWEDFYTSRPEPCFASIKGNALIEKERAKQKDPDWPTATVFTFDSRGKHCICLMPKDLVDKCEEYCKRNSVTFQSILYAAQMTYDTAMTGFENTCITSTVSRRATLAEKSSGGSRVHFNLYPKQIDASQTFLQAAKEIGADFNLMFKHISAPSQDNMYRMFELHGKKMVTAYHSMSITYQPIRISLPGVERIQMKWYTNGAASNHLYMTVVDGNCTGDLHFYYEYQTKHYTEDDIAKSHNGVMKILEAAVADENATAGQLREIVK